MQFIGTPVDVSGITLRTSDGETVMRIRSRALNTTNDPIWLMSEGYGQWREAQPSEAAKLEDEYDSIAF